jgi:elongation factor Ts
MSTTATKPNITAAMVKELRERTGGGMLECKKALEETAGNLEAAIDIMRKSGTAKAAKKAGRVAAEGIIVIAKNDQQNVAAMLELNCETDFVARNPDFLGFATTVVEQALKAQTDNLDKLLLLPYCPGGSACGAKTIAQAREELVGKLGENINIRRVTFMVAAKDGMLGNYIHGSRIGVLVELLGTVDQELAKDVAMHIVASNPRAVSAEELPKELLAKEREVYTAQVKDSGKPEAIMKKMIEGRLQKFINEIVLLQQPFVKDPTLTITDLLRKHKQAKVVKFKRFEVGEGIEKEETDFAKEVMAQVGGKL